MRPVSLWLLVCVASCGTVARREPSARATEVARLPERERELLAAYGRGAEAWASAREAALAEPRLTRFLIDNLALEMLRAYDLWAANGDPRAKVAFLRAQDELAGLPDAAAVLVELLRVGDGVAAELATQTLVVIGRGAALEVSRVLTDSDERARRRAAALLGRLPHAGRDEHAIRAALVSAALDDEAWVVRAEAARALGGRGARDVDSKPWRAALERSLTDEDAKVRECAAEGLASLADPAAIPALANALARGVAAGEMQLLGACQTSLRSLSGTDRERPPQEWLDWWREHRAELLQRRGE